MPRRKQAPPDGMTERDVQILAAWYFAYGDQIAAAKQLGVGPQAVRNALYQMRRRLHAKRNLELALRFQDDIDRLKGKPLNRAAPHGQKEAKAA